MIRWGMTRGERVTRMKNEAVKPEIKVWKTLPTAMRLQGWEKAGTTTDRTMLGEIARDYAVGGMKVAFTRGAMDAVHYWTKAS